MKAIKEAGSSQRHTECEQDPAPISAENQKNYADQNRAEEESNSSSVIGEGRLVLSTPLWV